MRLGIAKTSSAADNVKSSGKPGSSTREAGGASFAHVPHGTAAPRTRDRGPSSLMVSIEPTAHLVVAPSSFAVASPSSPSQRQQPPAAAAGAGKKSGGRLVPVGSSYKSSAASDGQASARMEEILSKTSDQRKRFTEFVRRKYATESLALYDESSKYVSSAVKATPHQRAVMGRGIVDKFFADKAPMAVDIPDEYRRRLLVMRNSNEFPPDAFNKARHIAFMLLRDNFYHQFVKEAGLEDAEEL